MERIKDFLLYCGVGKETFQSSRQLRYEMNRWVVSGFAHMSIAILSVVLIVSFATGVLAENRLPYLCGLISSVIIILSSRGLTSNRPLLHRLTITMFNIFIFGFGIYLGMMDYQNQTVNFMIMMVVVPIIMIERPLTALLTNIFFAAIFVALALVYKVPEVLVTDIADAIIYCVLGAVVGSTSNYFKLKGFYLEQKLMESSRLDMLTGMQNRNCFENDVKTLPEQDFTFITCVYADVNGLHEMNDTKGHASGDAMLQYVALRLREHFGSEHTYRVGGDEFIAFCPDRGTEEIVADIRAINEKINREGYFASFGTACMLKEQLDMTVLLRDAEQEMYRDKERYYSNTKRNRRGQR